MSRARLEAFTDGVFAILITILVLEIRLPEANHSWHALIPLIPVFAAYVLSFFLIAGMWVSHHALMLQTKVVTQGTLWANLFFLFWLSLMPAVAAWFGTDIHSGPAAFLFQLDIICVNLAFMWLRHVISQSNPGATHLRIKYEVWSFVINFVTLTIILFYPAMLFVGLSLNSFLWVVPTGNTASTEAA